MAHIPPKIRAELRRRKRRKALVLVVGFLLILLPARAVLGDKGWISTWRLRNQVRTVEEKVAALQRANRQLGRDIRQLRDGGHAIERIAREELGMAGPGEYVYHLPPPPTDPRTTARP